ncbi:hypothetical protein B0H15DRAFT_765352, partial [Mycena belliarum]
HRTSPECPCNACRDDRETRRCANPHACARAAKRRLDSLEPKWDPRLPQRLPPEIPESRAEEAFTAPPAITSLSEGFRVLTRLTTPDEL